MHTISNQIFNIIFIFIFVGFIFAAKNSSNTTINKTNTFVEHEVKAGDSLWNIAKKYNSSVNHIKTINNIKSDTIHVGWKIKIPNQAYIEVMNLDTKWDNALQFRKDSLLMESITLFKEIINVDKNYALSSKSQFQIADIYLNDINNYIFAIREFQKVVDNYPETDDAKKSIFMLGYINSNYIEAYSDAFFYYTMFLDKYPADELSYSVDYELQLLDSLNVLKDFRKNK